VGSNPTRGTNVNLRFSRFREAEIFVLKINTIYCFDCIKHLF